MAEVGDKRFVGTDEKEEKPHDSSVMISGRKCLGCSFVGYLRVAILDGKSQGISL